MSAFPPSISDGNATLTDVTTALVIPQTLHSEDTEILLSTGVLLLILLLCATLVIMHFINKHNILFFQLPMCATLLGIITGVLLKCITNVEKTFLSNMLTLNENVFFIFLLPPIIFEAGVSVTEPKLGGPFVAHIGPILCFAFFCTLCSFVLIGLSMFLLGVLHITTNLTLVQALAFGALISSTDPISVIGVFKVKQPHQLVYAIIIGESLFNDAISLVLYKAIASSNYTSTSEMLAGFFATFVVSLLIGVAVGLTIALVYKWGEFSSKENVVFDLALAILLPWSAYCFAEMYSFSGIVSICFCGIIMGKYSFHNLSEASQLIARTTFSALSLMAEALVFLLMGLAVATVPHIHATASFYISSFIIITAARFASVHLTSGLINIQKERVPIYFSNAIAICGFRGAIAFALSERSRDDLGKEVGGAILSVTLFYSLFTIIIIGGLLTPILKHTKVFGTPPLLDATTTAASKPPIDTTEHEADHGYVKRFIIKFDKSIMMPLFTTQDTVDAPTDFSHIKFLSNKWKSFRNQYFGRPSSSYQLVSAVVKDESPPANSDNAEVELSKLTAHGYVHRGPKRHSTSATSAE